MECNICQTPVGGTYVQYEDEVYTFGSTTLVQVVAHPSCYAKHRQKEYIPPGYCWHNWEEYIGFREKYWYCTLCNDKKEHRG